MRAQFRKTDWADTPLGPPQQWAHELVTSVDLLLNTPYPAVVVWGPEHTFLYNDAYAYMLGPRHPAALGQPFGHVWPEIWSEVRPLVEAAMRGIPAYLENTPVTISPGEMAEERWFTSSYAPVRDRTGRVLGMFNAGFETTAQVRDRRQLAFQLALVDALRPLSSADEIVATVARMLGEHLSLDRVIYAEVDEERRNFFVRHEWTREGMPSMSGSSHATGEFGASLLDELRAGHAITIDDVLKDPRTSPHSANYARIGVRANLRLPLVKDGQLSAVLGLQAANPRHWTEFDVQLVQDVAERTWLAVEKARAELQLGDTQAWLSAMFDSLPVGVGVFDAAGVIKLSNRAMRRYLPTGVLPSRDAARRSRWRVFNPDGTIAEPENFAGARALRGERVVPGIEALFRQDDGNEIWTEVAAVPILGDAGQVTGQVSVVHDIDMLKRTEAALRRSAAELAESNRRQSEFLAVLAHELRNPLAPILTGLELMRLRPDNVETAARVREIVERQTRQMVHLIDDLLDIARVTSGKIEIRRKLVDMRAAVATAVEASLPVIEKAGHELQVQLHEGPLTLSADATRLAQIVSNLLTNAAKYTPRGGTIRLVVEKDGEEAILSVSDTGLGIPADSLASIFEMFHQVKRNDEASPGGLGIGLALVRQLVTLHGGTVLASSDGTGRGSTFIVRLPLSREASAEEGSKPSSRSGNGRGLRILVVDDNVDAADSLAALLSAYGHHASVTHDGRDALKLAAASPPDVAFLDIGMPGLSGYEVARQMREMPSLHSTTLVALTGWGTEEDRRQARSAGFDAHFTKPLAPESIGRFLESADVMRDGKAAPDAAGA